MVTVSKMFAVTAAKVESVYFVRRVSRTGQWTTHTKERKRRGR